MQDALQFIATSVKKSVYFIVTTFISVICVFYLSYSTYNKLNYYYTGLNYAKKKQYETARYYYQLAINSGSQNPNIYNEIAWIDIEFLGREPQQANMYAWYALKCDENNANYLDTYGWTLYHLNKPEEAVIYLEKAFDLDADIFCIHYHLGVCYAKIGNRKKAIDHLQAQIKKNPNDRDGIKDGMLIKNLMN